MLPANSSGGQNMELPYNHAPLGIHKFYPRVKFGLMNGVTSYSAGDMGYAIPRLIPTGSQSLHQPPITEKPRIPAQSMRPI
jgi:hypothetical protein